VAAIDAPLLLIRPGDDVPLLLALPENELSEANPPSEPELLHELDAALEGNTEGVPGPRIVLPRLLLLIVVTRNVSVDAADPEQACDEISEYGPVIADWYRTLLELVRDSETERRLARALPALWEVSPEDLVAFLEQRPELASDAAVRVVSAELAAGPPPGESDAPLRARLRLVEALAADQPTAEAAAEYLASMRTYGSELGRRAAGLFAAIDAHPGPDGIPLLREALPFARAAGDEETEARLTADLAVRLLSQGRVDAVEEAINLLSNALALTPEDSLNWPIVAGNLATTYTRRLQGDSIENWTTAHDLLERASMAADRSQDPQTWAMNHTNLGFLLAERPGRTEDDLNRAINLVQEGLQERSPEGDRVDWSYSQLNLGLLYRRRNAEGDHRSAMESYRQALRHLQADDDRVLWAMLQHNLAQALLDDEPTDVVGAEKAADAAMAVTDEGADPLTAGRLLSLTARIADHRVGPLAPEALRARRRAAALLSPTLAPEEHLRIGGELTDAYAQLNDWNGAADAYEEMLAAYNTLYDLQTSAEGRRRVLGLSPRLARWAAFSLARTGRLERAVEVLEQGRARQLSLSASRETVELSRLAAVDRLLADQWIAALDEYRAALPGNQGRIAPATGTAQVSEAERHVRHLRQQIRAIPGFEEFLRPMTTRDVLAAGGGLPVVYLLNAPGGSYVLTLVQGPSGQPLVSAHEVAFTSMDVVSLLLFDINNVQAPTLLLAQSADLIRRRQLLPAALQRLARLQPLVDPVARTVTEHPSRSVVVVPTGLLGLLPLTAVPTGAVGGEVLDDLGEVRLAPSAAAYAASRRRALEPRQHHLVGVADTDPSSPLPGSQAELASVTALFSPSHADYAIGPQATRSWLLGHAPIASHLHLACHGKSELAAASGGTLRLAGGEELTMGDLLDGRLSNCRLAVASACQSGHFAMGEYPDEFTGLPAGLLQAGAACTIVSLWQVDDHATALLMTRLYELLDPNLSASEQEPVAALRAARAWLRGLTVEQAAEYVRARPALASVLDRWGTGRVRASAMRPSDRPYASPMYWATFVAYGC
jgi:CHAT domain-containing protein/tetratricopeptide (TPR) repeat protein